MPPWVWIIGVVVLTLLAVPSVIGSIMVGLMARGAVQLDSESPGEFRAGGGDAMLMGEWAEGEGFAFDGFYSFRVAGQVIRIMAWRLPDEPTWLCLNIPAGGPPMPEFTTVLNGNGGVTTGASLDGVLLPPPEGDYQQAFVGVDVFELWLRHKEAVQWLVEHRMAVVRSDNETFLDSVWAAMTSQSRYVTTLPLWPLRMPYWYHVRRRRVANKSVREQLEGRAA